MTGTNTIVNPNQFIPAGLESALFSPAGLGVIACGAVIVIAKIIDRKVGKAKLATARWGGAAEKKAARNLACKQIQKRLHNRVSLYIGTPKNTTSQVIDGIRKTSIPEDSATLYFPEAQRGILVCGGPGSGKSFSMIVRFVD